MGPPIFPYLVTVLSVAAWGCTDGCVDPDAISDLPLHLYDHLDTVEVEGVAAALVRGLPRSEERTLLVLDFEDGRLEPLVAFRSPDAETNEPRVVRAEGGFGSGYSVELRNTAARAASLRTPPISVEPGQNYRLRYRVAMQRAPGSDEIINAGASVLLYGLSSEQALRAATVLAEPARERALGLPPPRDLRV